MWIWCEGEKGMYMYGDGGQVGRDEMGGKEAECREWKG